MIKFKQTGIKALSFFSGAMGLDLGLQKAGIDIVLACEKDKICRKTILANEPDIVLLEDISSYSSDDILQHAKIDAGKIDIIAGGPPCQAFSTAGHRKGFGDTRGNAFLDFINLILALRPRYAVIENVRGLLSTPFNDSDAISHIMQQFQAGGYGVSFNLYNAANYGVPQIRERVVMICSRDGSKVPYMNPTHSEREEFGLPIWRTLKDAIGGLDLAECNHINFPEKRLPYYRMLKSGQNWRNLPVELQKEALGKTYYSKGGRTGFLRRLSWDKPSCTLLTNPAMFATDMCHPEENRPLSIQEYKRIQQFPDDWMVSGSLMDQYRQIGNAVPVGLGEAIGRTIIAHMSGQSVHPPQNFQFSRYKNTSDMSWKS